MKWGAGDRLPPAGDNPDCVLINRKVRDSRVQKSEWTPAGVSMNF